MVSENVKPRTALRATADVVQRVMFRIWRRRGLAVSDASEHWPDRAPGLHIAVRVFDIPRCLPAVEVRGSRATKSASRKFPRMRAATAKNY